MSIVSTKERYSFKVPACMSEMLPKQVPSATGAYAHVYQTADTVALDEVYGLKGVPLDARKSGQVRAMQFWVVNADERDAVAHFAELALRNGHFVGVPACEVEKATGGHIQRGCIDRCVESGYLAVIPINGKAVAVPTMKLM